MKTRQELTEILDFIADYATYLLASGVHTSRVIRNSQRIGQSQGVDIQLSSFQKSTILTVRDDATGEAVTRVVKIPALPISFERNSDLSALSWDALDDRLPLDEIRRRYGELIDKPRIDPIFVLVTVGLANASFCRLFGGDWTAAGIVFTATLVGFAASAVASTSLSDPLATWLMSFGIAPLSAIARGLAPVIITVAVAFVSIVIGELVPKRIGLANAEGVSKQAVGPLSFFQKIARPLVWLTGACSDGLARILRIKSADDRQNVSEEEIKYMVSEQDDLLDEEKRMIHEIFDLGDTVAREVMVPRVDTTMCEDDETGADVLSTMRQALWAVTVMPPSTWQTIRFSSS